ncbi:hypothetical protein A6R68_07245 [Neotoma lepida]|uniref:Uncharacterized protein n=1 Tax=Neotoma lepida TaxID=56216 RepID=A0A1A6GED8_NEOLE|nr:hypothetical protein A6R68_07245 [Neotoma lepida]
MQSSQTILPLNYTWQSRDCLLHPTLTTLGHHWTPTSNSSDSNIHPYHVYVSPNTGQEFSYSSRGGFYDADEFYPHGSTPNCKIDSSGSTYS